MTRLLGFRRTGSPWCRSASAWRAIAPQPAERRDVFRVGYFARVAPEKGLHVLAEAYVRFRQRAGRRADRLRRPVTWRRTTAATSRRRHDDRCSRPGSATSSPTRRVDRQGKLDFLRGLDVLSVPATYDEPKGMFLLEAMAAGVPVVQPRRGAFTEVVEKTGGGLLVAADDVRRAGRRAPSTLWSDRALSADAGGSRVRRRARSLHDRAVGDRQIEVYRVGGPSRRAGAAVLNVSGVGKQYPTPRGPLTVLSDVSFSLAPGDAAAITGPSGSGKSSLLYMLGALEPPTPGTITLDGRIRSRSEPRRWPIPQHARSVSSSRIMPAAAVHACSRTCSSRRSSRTSGNDDAPVRARTLHRTGGPGRRGSTTGPVSCPEERSSGWRLPARSMRSRVCVLCDEPTGNLDQASAVNVASMLLDLHRHAAHILIVVTHSERLAGQFPIRFDISDGRLRRVE